MKKLFIDIETAPHTVYTWDLYNVNIGVTQIIKPTRVICVAWQFDDGKMEFASEWQDGKKVMISRVWQALDEANAVIHYNGISFDERHLNREFLQAGHVPPSTFKSIDLYRTVKSRFKFAANKLAQVSDELEIRKGKLKTDFELWRDVLAKDPTARRKMELYNKEDVRLMVDLYAELLPWIDRHPNVALIDGTDGCTKCGSTNLIRNGFAYTGAGAFQQYRCKNCGANLRDSKRVSTTSKRESI